jgi:hypothetical protein
VKNQTIRQNCIENNRESEEIEQSFGRAEIIENLLHLFIVALGMGRESWFKVHGDGDYPERESEVHFLFDTEKCLDQYIRESERG